jgi:hypothetical protein
VNPLIRYATLALTGQGLPLLRLAQDGALPGASRDERRLGLVARVLIELTNAALYGDGRHTVAGSIVAEVDKRLTGKGLSQQHRDVLLAGMTDEIAYQIKGASALWDGLVGTNRATRGNDLHRAVAELAEALGVEMPLILEAAETLANAGSVDLGLYAWSQA